MQNLIKLQTDSVLQVPFQNYEKNFTFIVNSVKFETSIFQADLLSSTISKIHITDPTVKEFFINTENSGDFNHILKLLNFDEEIISEYEIPFIIEILEILGIEKINLKIQNNSNDKINISNILFRIRNNQKHPQLLSKQLEKDIEFFASHFNEIKDELLKQIEEKHFEIEEFVIENILNDPKLQLNNEDELLDFVNKLYKHDSKYSELYKYVDFNNVEATSIKEFVDIFDFNDMTHSMWLSITKSLQQKAKKNQSEIQEIDFDFKKHEEDFLTESEQINDEIEPINKEFEPNEDEFDGILNYLQTHSNIKNEIIIYSSSNRNYTDPYEIVNYSSRSSSSYILTRDKPNSWICIEFINHRIIPSGYIIESCNYDISETLRSWVIEGSNDNQYWKTLDSQINNDSLNGINSFHLFTISDYKYNTESFKYLRIRQIGSNWCENDSLFITSIEFYGKIK